jgi:hypothetical protein
MPGDLTIPEAKTVFLSSLADGYSVTASACRAGRDRSTVYLWRKADPAFAEAWAGAWESHADWYEDRNREQALLGSMPAILNGLRMHRRISDRLEHTAVDGGAVTVMHRTIDPATLAETTHLLEEMLREERGNGHQP